MFEQQVQKLFRIWVRNSSWYSELVTCGFLVSSLVDSDMLIDLCKNNTLCKTTLPPFSSWLTPFILPSSSSLFLSIITDSYRTTPFLGSETKHPFYDNGQQLGQATYFRSGLTIPFQRILLISFPASSLASPRNMESNISLSANSPNTVASR